MPRYTCRRENSLARMTLAPAQLLPLLALVTAVAVATNAPPVRTRIIQPPQDLEVAVGKRAKFRCNAVADPAQELTIEWMFRGEPIDFEADPRLARWYDNSLVITQTVSLDSGVYTCVASTAVDSDRAQASLMVQDVPNAPQVISVECKAATAILKWMPRGDNRAPILSYTVQYSTTFTPNKWENAITNIPAADTEVNLSLSPWTNYTFQVVAHNKIGRSAPSQPPSTMCSTHDDVPYKNPENVVGRGDRPDSLVISWTPMPMIDHNAPGFFYKVHWKRLDSPDDTWMSHIVEDWKQDRHIVQSQPTFASYRIRVEAHNRRGQARTSAVEVIGYSGEDVPLEEPKDFKLVRVLGSRTATFSWNPVSAESVRGHLRGYKIRPRRSGDEDWLFEVWMPANSTKAELSVFQPFTHYLVSVLAFNDGYDGPPSETIEFTTPEGTPGPVADLEGIPTGSTGFYLAWKRPAQPNGILTGYHIYYQEVRGTEVGPEMQRLPPVRDPLQMSARLTGLRPNTVYRITVRAATALGLGDRYFTELRTAEPSERMPDVPDFTWARISDNGGDTSIKVTWVPSTSGHPGSDFYVQYRRKGEEVWQRTNVETRRESILLSGLEADALYELRVVAVDGRFETASRIEEIQTRGIRQ